jgi:aspartyl-tRNA(Asn)/glutamyl-tRNA(Gln) amidotransferase subunit B
VVDKVLAANTKAVRDYGAGKKEAMGFLVGQVMRETRGRANPGLVNQILQERLAGRG